DNLLEDVDYFDGLGRPMQKVSIQVSPGGQDIVTPVSYDAFGREDKKYLPYALTAANNGAFVTNDKVESRWTNNYGTAEDGFAFAKTEFEPSPLNRVLKQGAPGATWQPNTVAASDRSVKFAYGSNIAADNVRMWTVNSDGSPASTSAYPVNSLYKTTIWDENNPNDLATTTSRTEEFKDLRGKVVLKRTYKGATTGSEALSTYYVYDDFELLRVVIPPLANGDGGNVAAVLSDLCYQYTYDTRKRMTVKKLPGADAVYMVYDQRDRLVAVQDGVQRAKSPDEWTFTKYDALNRTVMTGIYKVADATTPATVQATVNGISVYSEDRLITGYGYTNNSFPKLTGTTPVSITEADILTIIYYDTYGFPGAQAFDISVSNISGYDEGTTYEGTNRYYFEQLKGQVTGTKTKVLETTTFLTSTNYYDDHYRVIQGTRSLYDGFTGTETAYSKYDFVGKVIQTKQTQNFYSTALVKTTTTVDKYFTYDHAGRLKTTEQQITGDANGKVTVAANTYNEIGQLIDKKLHNNAQQSIDYQYNIRGWLTSINNPDNLANDGTGDTYADLFAERLLYNDNSTISNLTLKNQYNGNICGIILNRRSDATAATIKSAYGLTYDGLNRLNEATYAENTGSGYSINLNSYNEFGITYDKNGNILTLKRNSSGTLVDNLAYTYESANKSNRLQTVADNSNNITGFTDITNANDYTYDNNGNAAKDLNKGITGILYNVLNLPKTVTKDASNSITYTYTASGEKVMQATKVSGITTNRCYAGLFEYDNLKALSLVKMDEGIVTKTSSTYVYEYYLKDHLGNTRITFSPGASGPVLAQRTDYYPFGLACTNQYMGSTGNGYLYNGKELQKALGWQVYDYGARFYDPTIGRWHVTDPMGEKHYNYTPYAYVYNNPITLIDPLGLDSVYFSTQGKVVDRKVNKSQDKFFTRTYEEKKVSTEDGSTVTTGTETKDTEISMDSDIGTIARTTYAEMRGGDDNAKSIVAESIVNRSNLPDGSYEKADGTITGIVNKSYDVTKNTNKANPVFKNPENYFNNNSTENSAWLSSLGSAVKAYYGNSNVGKGVIFYNSSSSTIYDKNPNMQKINLSITVLGIKGLWKLK
ncbi:MAG TPA: DUF6443 domain-containing protein, partial [Prolixibacteraceae bacterium]